jgi:hypothetical protein
MGTGERQERAARGGTGGWLAGLAARVGAGGGPASWVKGKRALAVAAALGLLAGGIGFGAIRAREREVREGWALTEVLVATADLGAGEVLAGEHVGRRQIPARFVTTSVLRPEHAVQAVGQRLLVPVQAGDPLLWTHFETLRGVERLANVVQPRGRAVTMPSTTPGRSAASSGPTTTSTSSPPSATRPPTSRRR